MNNDLTQAISHHQGGRFDKAKRFYKRFLRSNPNHQEAMYNTGVLLAQTGQFDEAIGFFAKVIALTPDSTDAHRAKGGALKALGRLDEAVDAFRRAQALEPNNVELLNNLGACLTELNRVPEAEETLRRALTIQPNVASTHYNLGLALFRMRRAKDAEDAFRKAITLHPSHLKALNNLGHSLNAQGRTEEAVDAFRSALAVDTTFASAHSNLLLSMNYSANFTQQEIFTESQRWSLQHAHTEKHQRNSFRNVRESNRRLRIGYVSPDFREHSVAYFAEPLIAAHNPDAVSVFCYSDVPRPDETTRRIEALADTWRPTSCMSDAELQRCICKDRIDILVDLAGHTAKSRLAVFSRRSAPVQVSWLGYCNTTGIQAIDYRLTDSVADPEDEADLHTETLWRLPRGFLCYKPGQDTPEILPRPSLSGGRITFGSFNNLAKTTPQVITSWAHILSRTPQSRIVLKNKSFTDPRIRAAYLEQFSRHGIECDRVELLGRMQTTRQHLEAYRKIDIGLDPFPYNGTTTTLEALWMGVPVITLCGDRHASRVGASILTGLGMQALIARSAQDYISIATSLAGDTERLTALHTGLRGLVQRSLCDAKLFARQVEDAYRGMWQIWCTTEGNDRT
jgi:predicted O-linked N-acetylglucosamine transferase (SPINDLY family)